MQDREIIQPLIKQAIEQATEQAIHHLQLTHVPGGCINLCYKAETGKQHFFVKVNASRPYPRLLSTEKNGLLTIHRQQCIQTPSVIYHKENDTQQLLLMEWINEGKRTIGFWEKLGEQLACLHKVTQHTMGFEEDNYIGSLPQSNTSTSTWKAFFIEQRLQPQLMMALDKKLLDHSQAGLFEKLYPKLPEFLEEEPASLLHGDLWQGNIMCNEKSEPVLIDPAVYYGNRQMDLAMTTLFGGFDPAFYSAYDAHFPLPANHREQWDICNLYPLLVHVNLFGGHYGEQVLNILKRYT